MTTGGLTRDLHDAIVASGYFPQFIEATLAQAIGDERVVNSVVHHEATFNHDAIHRHVTVLVLTPTRFLVSHTDDGDQPGPTQALSTIESVALSQIRSVSLTHVVTNPERYGTGGMQPTEVWLSIGWGVMRRLEIEPATCGDPDCDADHGYTASDASDDLTVRVSSAADGTGPLHRLIDFGTALQRATGTGAA
ncbi:DUF5998 family protein [Nigerium massiliense]|uniref:DUF5998 family protein n=1 Tax=Nigerium massiliense TaxID=1522317 RepID=UPI00058F52DF|nr:DUF5998 family protein [Nigerium massiliense]